MEEKFHKPKSAFTWRALIIGSILSFFVSVAGPYADNIIQGSALMITTLPLIAVALLFFLIFLLNIPLTKLGIGLNSGELRIIFIMMFVACAIPTMGLSEQLIPIIAGGKYFATETNRWEELILSHAPKWLFVHDEEAVKGFFEGISQGERIPWSSWAVPLTAWVLFILSLYMIMYSLMVIFRKQWMEKERLGYPLLQLPEEMMNEPEKGSLLNRLFKNPLFWLGFTIPVIISTINGLHAYFPLLPQIPLYKTFLLFRNTTPFRIKISFPVIGMSYLLPTEISLSLWLFSILGSVQTGIFHIIGFSIGPREPYCASSPSVSHQGFGAMIALVIFILWNARSHLKEVFRKAFKGESSIDDKDEPLSYRASVLMLIFSVAFALFWLIKSGLSFHLGVILLFSAFIIFLSLTRVIIQGGTIAVKSPLIPQVFTIAVVGSKSIGLTSFAALAYSFVWCADLMVFLMPHVGHSLKLAHPVKMNKKLITLVIFLAILISMGGSIWTIIKMGYKYGGVNLNQWYFRGCPQEPFIYIADKIKHPTGICWKRWMFTGIGAVVMGLLIFMRSRLVWWPIHPLGFPVANTLPINVICFSIFLGWLIKSIVLRYGGAKVYNRTKPIFLGLILGQFVIACIWLIIDFVTGMKGNVIYTY